jgi:hypothetical protein
VTAREGLIFKNLTDIQTETAYTNLNRKVEVMLIHFVLAQEQMNTWFRTMHWAKPWPHPAFPKEPTNLPRHWTAYLTRPQINSVLDHLTGMLALVPKNPAKVAVLPQDFDTLIPPTLPHQREVVYRLKRILALLSGINHQLSTKTALPNITTTYPVSDSNLGHILDHLVEVYREVSKTNMATLHSRYLPSLDKRPPGQFIPDMVARDQYLEQVMQAYARFIHLTTQGHNLRPTAGRSPLPRFQRYPYDWPKHLHPQEKDHILAKVKDALRVLDHRTDPILPPLSTPPGMDQDRKAPIRDTLKELVCSMVLLKPHMGLFDEDSPRYVDERISPEEMDLISESLVTVHDLLESIPLKSRIVRASNSRTPVVLSRDSISPPSTPTKPPPPKTTGFPLATRSNSLNWYTEIILRQYAKLYNLYRDWQAVHTSKVLPPMAMLEAGWPTQVSTGTICEVLEHLTTMLQVPTLSTSLPADFPPFSDTAVSKAIKSRLLIILGFLSQINRLKPPTKYTDPCPLPVQPPISTEDIFVILDELHHTYEVVSDKTSDSFPPLCSLACYPEPCSPLDNLPTTIGEYENSILQGFKRYTNLLMQQSDELQGNTVDSLRATQKQAHQLEISVTQSMAILSNVVADHNDILQHLLNVVKNPLDPPSKTNSVEETSPPSSSTQDHLH